MIITYLAYCSLNRGLSRETCRAYEVALRSFARFINTQYAGTRWSTVTREMVEAWVLSQVSEDYNPSTIKQRVSVLRGFYRCMRQHGANITNPAQYVSTPKMGVRLPSTVSPEAVAAALKDPLVNPVAKAAVAILYETGIRAQELCSLSPSDINQSERSFVVLGKGRKERRVFYGELTVAFGRYWPFGQVQQRTLRHMVFDALAPHVARGAQVSPHVLRHTFACECLNNGLPLDSIAALMGHKSVETTRIYAQVATDTLARQYRASLPSLPA